MRNIEKIFLKSSICVIGMLLTFLVVVCMNNKEVYAEDVIGSQTVYTTDIKYDEASGYYVQVETTEYSYQDDETGEFVRVRQIVKYYYTFDGESYTYVDSIKTVEYIQYPTALPSGAPTIAPTNTPKPSPTKRPTPNPTATPKPTARPGETVKPEPTPKPTENPAPTFGPTKSPVPTLKPMKTPRPLIKATPTPYVLSPYVEFDTEPMELKAGRRSYTKARIRWEQHKQADGYYIYRSTKESSGYKKIATLKDKSITTYYDKSLKKKKIYYYKIKAYVYTVSGVLTTEMSERNQVPLYKTQKIENKLDKLQEQFPTGKYWNHVGHNVSVGAATYNYVTNKPCKNHNVEYTSNRNNINNKKITCNSFTVKLGKTKSGKPKYVIGYQCYGFANMIGYKLFGDTSLKVNRSYKKAKVGDHVRKGNHSMVIIEKYDDYIIVAECNVGGKCRIQWGAKIRKSQLKNAIYYTRY